MEHPAARKTFRRPRRQLLHQGAGIGVRRLGGKAQRLPLPFRHPGDPEIMKRGQHVVQQQPQPAPVERIGGEIERIRLPEPVFEGAFLKFKISGGAALLARGGGDKVTYKDLPLS